MGINSVLDGRLNEINTLMTVNEEVNEYLNYLGKTSFRLVEAQLDEEVYDITLSELAELASEVLDLPYNVIVNGLLAVEGGVFSDIWE